MKFKKTKPDRPHLAQRAISWAVHFLDLEDTITGVRFFEPDSDDPGDDTTEIRWRGDMEAPKELKGCALEFDSEIYVRKGLSPEEMVITIGHEAFHKWEYLTRNHSSEQDAEAFGEQLLQWIKYDPRSRF